MDLDTYRSLRLQARRLSRSQADAEDLVQDTLLAALRAGRDDPAWLAGVLRRQAALAARTAVRRQRREAVAGAETVTEAAPEPTLDAAPAPTSPDWLHTLPPAARRVAVLALHGLSADEIRWILGLPATAFRQRLSSIRRHIGALPPRLQAEARALAFVRDPARSVELQFGLVRRALQAAMRPAPALGSHDDDGHLLLVRRGAHVSGPRGNG